MSEESEYEKVKRMQENARLNREMVAEWRAKTKSSRVSVKIVRNISGLQLKIFTGNWRKENQSRYKNSAKIYIQETLQNEFQKLSGYKPLALTQEYQVYDCQSRREAPFANVAQAIVNNSLWKRGIELVVTVGGNVFSVFKHTKDCGVYRYTDNINLVDKDGHVSSVPFRKTWENDWVVEFDVNIAATGKRARELGIFCVVIEHRRRRAGPFMLYSFPFQNYQRNFQVVWENLKYKLRIQPKEVLLVKRELANFFSTKEKENVIEQITQEVQIKIMFVGALIGFIMSQLLTYFAKLLAIFLNFL